MSGPDDTHDLGRFLQAQAGSYAQALSEIRSGRKRSHWMWYVFPQMEGLGLSPLSRRYAIRALEEAKAYLGHPVLGPRLLECAEAVVSLEGRSATEVFGSPDDVKLRSSATLFAHLSPPGSVFDRLLLKYYGGLRDDRTLRLLGVDSEKVGMSSIGAGVLSLRSAGVDHMNLPLRETGVTVAVVQAGSVPFDTGACVEKAVRLIESAAATGAKVIVFPEAFIGGYPKGLTFGAVVGARDAEGREEFRRYHESAIEVQGAETERLGKAAAAHGSYVVMGAIERDGGTCYCTALFFGPDGSLLGKHRKLMPTAMERLIWGFVDGSTLTTVDSPYGRIGSVICWENYMPMLRMAMYSKNVALYCAPTADDRDTWLPSMQHVALEGRCFVLTACQLLRKGDFPETVRVTLGDSADSILMRGGSAIISPFGKVLAGPVFGEEAILTATLDLDEIPRSKFDFDVVGHYSRPDVFQLIVNEAPARPVTS